MEDVTVVNENDYREEDIVEVECNIEKPEAFVAGKVYSHFQEVGNHKGIVMLRINKFIKGTKVAHVVMTPTNGKGTPVIQKWTVATYSTHVSSDGTTLLVRFKSGSTSKARPHGVMIVYGA